MTITDKTQGLIVVGDKLYKLTSSDFKILEGLLHKPQSYMQGNKLVWVNTASEFIDLIEAKQKPIANIFGIY